MSIGTKPAGGWLSQVTTKPKAKPAAIVLAGPPGVGKSSLAGNIPGALALPCGNEDTWELLKSTGAVPESLPVFPTPIQSWQHMLEVVNELTTTDHGHKAHIVDTINVIEQFRNQHVCDRDYAGNWGKDKGFEMFDQGPRAGMADWRQLLCAFDKMRVARDVRVILLAHIEVRPFRNPEGADYDRYAVGLHKTTWALTHGWADAVLFANYFTAVDVDEKTKRAKGKGGRERVLHTVYSPAYDAKNRFNLPEEIDMGDSGAEAWGNLAKAIVAGRK